MNRRREVNVRLVDDGIPPTTQTIVDALEAVLREARAGRVTDLAVVHLTVDGMIFTEARFKDQLRLLGAVDMLKNDVMYGGKR